MEAIVLAAGYSSRANAFKMTLPLGKLTVLEHTISKFDGLCSRVIVAAGVRAELILEEIAKITDKKAYSFEIKCVYNENFKQGMFSSIQKSVSEVKASSFFLTPGDSPLVQKETVQRIAEHKGSVVIPSFHFKGGHPIKLSNEVKLRILETDWDSTLRMVLSSFEKEYVNIEDPGIIMDVDTPEDYQKAIDYYDRNFRQ